MTYSYSFSHYSGAGNSFFFVDNRKKNFPLEAVSEICYRNGIDGLIFLEESERADYRMRIFNPDNSEAEMCGNGLRCFIKYLQELGLLKDQYAIETLAGIHHAWVEKDSVAVRMRPPSEQKWNLMPNLHFLNTGVPHAILFVDHLDTINVVNEGPKFRYHPFFAPAGANVNFVALKDANTIMIRTYERGVERETLACGTGAVAAALATAHCFSYVSPIDVQVRSGEKLKISFTSDFQNIEMKGGVRLIKRGSFSLNWHLNTQFSIMHPL